MIVLLSVLLAGTLSGCVPLSAWNSDEAISDRSQTPALPLRKISRSVEIESRFVQVEFDPTEPDQLQSIWQWADETVIPPELRRRLLRNGLRVGKVTQPDRIDAKLDLLRSKETRSVVDTFLASAEVASHQMQGSKTIPMRIGKRVEMP
ncbi:MAG: hypothetical protein AAF802_31185, partial [Planctomycetota bacterium]